MTTGSRRPEPSAKSQRHGTSRSNNNNNNNNNNANANANSGGGNSSTNAGYSSDDNVQVQVLLANTEDNVSAMSEDNTATSNLSIWAQTKMILMGQNPNDAIMEEELDNNNNNNNNDQEVVGLSIPVVRNNNSSSRVQNVNTSLEKIVSGTNSNNNYQYHDNYDTLGQQEEQEEQQQQRGVSWKDPVENSSQSLQLLQSSSSFYLDFSNDAPREMTWSRRIALFLSKRYSWYNPILKKKSSLTTTTTTTTSCGDNNTNVQPGEENEAITNNNHDNNNNESLMQVLTKSNKNRLILNDAYPFTHSSPFHPSLESAWAYFEHVALPRYIVKPKETPNIKKNICTRIVRKVFRKGNKQLQRAEPGERENITSLYDPIFTPHKQLGDFGLGIGLYFSTLRAITVWTFLAGVLNTANLMYFHSSQYNDPNNPNVYNTTMRALVMGSAICTDTSWVVCTDCNHENAKYYDERISTSAYSIETGTNATFVLRNNCVGATIEQGMISYATLLFIMIGTIVLSIYLTRMEVAYDEDEQTAQDYSVIVQNPPPDATTPQEWHDFFKVAFNAHVTACTVAVDNDLLVRTLVARREILRKIELIVEPGTSLDTLTIARLAAKEERERRFFARFIAFFVPSIPEFFSQLTVMNAKVQGLAQLTYPATTVFVSFETEKSQREVLEAYNLGSLDVKNNNTTKMKNPQQHLFRTNLVLKLSEPNEPSTVRWQDLNVKFKERIKQQLLTAFCTLVAIFVIAFIVRLISVRGLGTQATAYTIAIFNVVFPEFAKFLTDFEAHASESDKQRSLYSKIALFRWVNTAIVITLITPFTSTLSNEALIEQIAALFYADLTTTNAIQIVDPFGHIQRHILAPRAKTQDAMNLLMQGSVYQLAERYTNMTKILFLALWYCAIFPGALYLCSFSLLVMYFTDRFSIMRTWKRAPQLGPRISQFSRRYFFSLAILAMAIMSSYYWASFPFDNVCDTGEPLDPSYNGTWVITATNPQTKEVGTIKTTISVGDTLHSFCLQDFFRYPRNEVPFPFVPRNQIKGQEWMTEDQEIVTNIYGWSAIGVLAMILFSYLWKWYLDFMTLFRGTYEPCGDDMGINFSDVQSMSTYVPQVQSQVFSYPLLASNIDSIDTDLLDWTDPDRKHSYYDLTKDAEVLLRGKDFGNNVVFSQIAHWPPPGKEKQKKKKSTKRTLEANPY